MVSYRRNIKDMPFVKTLTDSEQAVGVVRSMSEIYGDDFEFKALKNLPIEDCLKLLEQGVITQELIDMQYVFVVEPHHFLIVETCTRLAALRKVELSDKLIH